MSDTFDRDGFREDMGQRLKVARRAKMLTQAEVAEQVGCSRAAYANIEVGRQSVSADLLWRIAIVLDKPIQALMPVPAP